jgi:hypothetical protein
MSRWGLQLAPFDSNGFYVTSPFFRARVLAILRLLIATYTFLVLLITLIFDGIKHEAQQ